MRGLGIGIVVTALLMGVTGREKLPLSDAEIRAKALSLGMVDGESRRLADITNSPLPSGTVPVSDSEASSGESEEGVSKGEGAQGAEGMSQQESASETVPETGGDEPAESPVTVVIEAGTTSSQVSRMLAEAGLVEDAVEFDNYLCASGYSTSIAAGTYEIWPGTSEEELVKLIMKK